MPATNPKPERTNHYLRVIREPLDSKRANASRHVSLLYGLKALLDDYFLRPKWTRPQQEAHSGSIFASFILRPSAYAFSPLLHASFSEANPATTLQAWALHLGSFPEPPSGSGERTDLHGSFLSVQQSEYDFFFHSCFEIALVSPY